MHLRISTRRQGKQLYRYAQLVQSYRRADGMPTGRVIGNLGRLSELGIADLRAALRASREGRRVVVAEGEESG